MMLSRRSIAVTTFLAIAIGCAHAEDSVPAAAKESYVLITVAPIIGAPSPRDVSAPPKEETPDGGSGQPQKVRSITIAPRTYAADDDWGQACDVCANGVDNCGHTCGGGVGGGSTCGSDGQCPCSGGGSILIGVCSQRDPSHACTYCPTGTELSDPCGTACVYLEEFKPPPNLRQRCPSGYPVSCGADHCCPSDHSLCCKNPSYCGTDQAACDVVDTGYDPYAYLDPGTSGGGGGGGGSFNCSASNPQVTCSVLTSCSRCSISNCGGPNGSGCAFYKTSDGNVFSGLSPDGTNRLNAAAQEALEHCGCT